MNPLKDKVKQNATPSQIRRRVMNHDEFIRFLLGAVKGMQSALDACQRDIKTLNSKIERMDAE